VALLGKVMDLQETRHFVKSVGATRSFTAVVLAGGGHAWKRGIPEQVRRRSNVPYRVILPEEQGRLARDTVSPEDADYLWLSI